MKVSSRPFSKAQLFNKIKIIIKIKFIKTFFNMILLIVNFKSNQCGEPLTQLEPII